MTALLLRASLCNDCVMMILYIHHFLWLNAERLGVYLPQVRLKDFLHSTTLSLNLLSYGWHWRFLVIKYPHGYRMMVKRYGVTDFMDFMAYSPLLWSNIERRMLLSSFSLWIARRQLCVPGELEIQYKCKLCICKADFRIRVPCCASLSVVRTVCSSAQITSPSALLHHWSFSGPQPFPRDLSLRV